MVKFFRILAPWIMDPWAARQLHLPSVYGPMVGVALKLLMPKINRPEKYHHETIEHMWYPPNATPLMKGLVTTIIP